MNTTAASMFTEHLLGVGYLLRAGDRVGSKRSKIPAFRDWPF